jgi:hypothetical protein
VAAAVAAAAPPRPPVAGGAAVGAAAAAGAAPALVRARCAVYGAAVLGGRVSVGGADSGVIACALVVRLPLGACVAAFTHALCRGPVSMKWRGVFRKARGSLSCHGLCRGLTSLPCVFRVCSVL